MDILVEAMAFLETAFEKYDIALDFSAPELVGDEAEVVDRIEDYIMKTRAVFREKSVLLKRDLLKGQYQRLFGSSFLYEFAQDDFERIQGLINKLRDFIKKAKGLDSSHQQRLLSRLENLQKELNKRVSDLDRFWGLIGDAGEVARKLGEDAKPIVDRIREIAEIVWRTQTRAEELPSDTPPPTLLSLDQEDGDD